MSKHTFCSKGCWYFWGELSDVINCSCMIGVVDGSHWSDPCNSYDSPQNDLRGWVNWMLPNVQNQIPAFWDGAKIGHEYVCWGSHANDIGVAKWPHIPDFHAFETTALRPASCRHKVKRYAIQARGLRCRLLLWPPLSWMTHPVVNMSKP